MSTTASPTSNTNSFSVTQSFSNPIPSSSSDSGGGGNGSGGAAESGGGLNGSASLYLYTFLATLILLLGVSAAIVFRSLVLRRRHRAMVAEAIRNGTWVPPAPAPGFGRRGGGVDPAKAPILWEARIPVDEKSDEGPRSEGNTPRTGWDTFKPVALTYIEQPNSPDATPPSTTTNAPSIPARTRWWNLRQRGHTTAPPPSEVSPSAASEPTELATLPTPSTATEPAQEAKPMHVSVLLAMPRQHNWESDELPPMEIGVGKVYVRGL
ncbi:hypothetical protein CYLTODRAFT_423597 [Cylindrobasidium torrendii FP15055 ss-10]|uniref:Uncharacterized protein n=1 Tax=Cylindrobasidium torrendii FP15055 ss-10 TaxID=1314674 RepID=A0A0D7B6T0_9AGAR|nr:hypothetical protein CYLTODRAFT_423597 [Cylindrobasidium torrendii FP15055 ss-10]